MNNLLDNTGITVNLESLPHWAEYVAQRDRMRKWWMWFVRVFRPIEYEWQQAYLEDLSRMVRTEYTNAMMAKYRELMQ